MQGIVPESTLQTVKELFVPDYLQERARGEAEQLPVLDISEVGHAVFVRNKSALRNDDDDEISFATLLVMSEVVTYHVKVRQASDYCRHLTAYISVSLLHMFRRQKRTGTDSAIYIRISMVQRKSELL